MDILIPIWNPDEISGLTVKGAGSRISTADNRLTKPRVLEDYALVYLLEGTGEFISGNDEYSVEAGNVLILFPGIHHLYGPKEGDAWKEIWCIFSGPAVFTLQKKNILRQDHPVYTYSPYRRSLIAQTLQRLADRYRILGMQRNTNAISMTADLYHALLLILSHDEISQQNDEQQLHEVTQMQDLLESHMMSDMNIAEYFFTRNDSYHTLRLKFRKLSGISPSAYLNSLRIERAKHQLLFSDMPIQEIAASTGIHDQLYFSRLFKKYTGESPSKFRSRFLKNSYDGARY